MKFKPHTELCVKCKAPTTTHLIFGVKKLVCKNCKHIEYKPVNGDKQHD